MPLRTAPLLLHAARLLKSGRPADAIPYLQEAAALDPANPTIRHDLGLACLESARLPEAAAAFQASIALNPDYTDSHFRLGLTFEKFGDTDSAVRAYHRATELLPSHTEAWFRAGALVFTMGHQTEAIGCFRRAAASGPKTSFGRLGRARALLAEQRDAEAQRILRHLLALDRTNALAHDLLGNLLADAGRFEEARACFANAIAQAPLMAGSYYDLVRCRRITQAEHHLPDQIEAALATPGLDDAQRVRVHLAVGKAADDLGDPARAMRHFDAADALRSAARPFDAAVFDSELRHLAARFPPALIARAGSLGSPDRTPILILGLPRSGTTLVEQIISAHPDVAAGGELAFWNERGAASVQPGTAGTGVAFLAQAAADYLAVLRAISPDAKRVTDKMPFNVIWAGLIHLACPGATLVYCRRLPIDTALSIHQTHFNPNLAFPTGGEALVRYIRSIDRLAGHWRAVLPRDRFVEIAYEDLTATPEPVIRHLIAACGLPWNDACLHPERNTRIVRTASKWQARQPINTGAVERWRRYEQWLGKLQDLL